MNKSDAARVLPIANNEKYFCVKERTSIRLVGKLGVTLTWIAGSKLETCNKVCITQGPASRGTKNEFIIGEIIEVLNVGDLTAKHPYYNNCRLHHYALDKSSSDNPLLKLENTVNRINPSIPAHRKIIIFKTYNSQGPIHFSENGLSLEEYIRILQLESENDVTNDYNVEGNPSTGPFYYP